MATKRFFIFIVSYLSFINTIKGQGETNFWFFGQNAGMDFNSGVPVVLTNGALNTSEGCAAISSSNGTLLFYTDGVTVWNNQHTPMPNGNGLMGGSASTQSAIIVPKPGSNTVYYIFTVAASGGANGLRYSEVDMTLAGGLGDVTAIKNVLLHTPVTEKLTAVQHNNNLDFWVIAHESASNVFLAFSVTTTGVNNVPVTSNTGLTDPTAAGAGYIKASVSGTKLAMALSSQSKVNILNFNRTTGIITNDFNFTTLFLNPYGVEFSPDDSKLYVSSSASPNLYQYNMSQGTPASITASATIVGVCNAAIFGLGALQTAPDGKIYLAKINQDNLACITNPNGLAVACGFTDNAVNLQGKISKMGLPGFIPTYFDPPQITYNNTCFGDSTVFTLLDTSLLDSVRWNFGDPASGITNTSTLLSPVHIFSAPGTYTVSVITYIGTDDDTASVELIIAPLPETNLPDKIGVCDTSPIVLYPGGGFINYMWQDSTTDSTLTITTVGTYWVTVTNAYGCSLSDTVNVTDGEPPQVNLGPDTIICQYDRVILSPGNGFVTYLWQDNTNSSAFSTSSGGVYWVTVTDSIGCTGSDSVTVTIEDCECNVGVPAAFSPNGDGHNDILFIRGYCIKEVSLKIYDRWGEKVFETQSQETGWDGSFRGKSMNTGGFGYYLNATMMDGREISAKGNISLIR